jgi:hypothetical protein
MRVSEAMGDEALFLIEAFGWEHMTSVLGDEVGSLLVVFGEHFGWLRNKRRSLAVIDKIIEGIDIFE